MASTLALGGVPDGFDVVKDFDMKYKDKMCQLGNLFLTPTGSSSWAYHAGICCGDDEIIHLTQNATGSSGSSSGQGNYSKTSVKLFSSGQKSMILRKKGPLPDNFKHRVKKAMNSGRDYNLATYNCIHFALELIDYEG